MNRDPTMHEIHRPICPLCGNDRLVHVTTFHKGVPDGRKTFCAGQLGCHAWWNVETRAPEPSPFPRSIML